MTGRRLEPRTMHEDPTTEAAPPTTVSLDEWRIRLRTDPRGTVGELLELFAVHRSPVPRIEAFFGRVVADHGTPPELVRAVLGRLRIPVDEPEGAGDLLDLDREHRVRLRGRLRVVATEALPPVVPDPEAREAIAADPMRLAETAFVQGRRWGEAASLFALEHDHLPARGPVAGVLARASLRYALARSLHRVEGEADRAVEVMETASGLARRAVSAVDDADPRSSFAARLAFHVHVWLGFRHHEAGRSRAAERELQAAVETAPDAELAAAARMFSAYPRLRDQREREDG